MDGASHSLSLIFYYDILAIVTKIRDKTQWSEILSRWLEDAVSKVQTDNEFRSHLTKPEHITATLDQCFSVISIPVQVSDDSTWRTLLGIAGSTGCEVAESAKSLIIHYLHHTHRIKVDDQTLTLLSTINSMERSVKKLEVPLDLQSTQFGEAVVVLKCLIEALAKARPMVVQVVSPPVPDVLPIHSTTVDHMSGFPALRPGFISSSSPHTYPPSTSQHAFPAHPSIPSHSVPPPSSADLHTVRPFQKFPPTPTPPNTLPPRMEPLLSRNNDVREVRPPEPLREIQSRIPEPVAARVIDTTPMRTEAPQSRIPPDVPSPQVVRPPPQTVTDVKGEPRNGNGAEPARASITPAALPPPTNSAPLIESAEAEAPDWVTGYNPAVPKELHVELLRTHEHDSVVCSACFSQGGRYLATGCNGTAKIYDVLNGGEEIKTLRVSDDQEESVYVRSVQFSPDVAYLATASEDAVVRVWDVAKGTVSQTLRGHQTDAYSTAFSPDGHFLVSGSGDKTVKVWDVRRGQLLETLGNIETGPTDGVTCVAVSPDGLKIAAASLDRVVRMWDTQTGSLVHSFTGHHDAVYSVAFSPDGKTLASGSLDKTVRTWDISSKSCSKTLTGHRDFVLTVAFLPDGEWLLSGSKDQSVNFWNYRTGLVYVILRGHRNSVISLATENNLLASASGDHRARVWHVSALTQS